MTNKTPRAPRRERPSTDSSFSVMKRALDAEQLAARLKRQLDAAEQQLATQRNAIKELLATKAPSTDESETP